MNSLPPGGGFGGGGVGGGGMGGPMAFIKSRAKVYDPETDEQVTFADVA
jgi:ATP-dependent Zn protease